MHLDELPFIFFGRRVNQICRAIRGGTQKLPCCIRGRAHHERQKQKKAEYHEAKHRRLAVPGDARLLLGRCMTLLRFYASQRAHRVNTEDLPVTFIFGEVVEGCLVK